MGFSVTEIVLLYALFNTTCVVAAPLVGKLGDRVGAAALWCWVMRSMWGSCLWLMGGEHALGVHCRVPCTVFSIPLRNPKARPL